jgi:hypothetical protein
MNPLEYKLDQKQTEHIFVFLRGHNAIVQGRIIAIRRKFVFVETDGRIHIFLNKHLFITAKK